MVQYIRSNVCQNHQIIETTKRLNETERAVQRARAEVVRLKIKMDEIVKENAPSNASPAGVDNPRRIVENLKFMLEKEAATAAADKSCQAVLKERVVLQSPIDTTHPETCNSIQETVPEPSFSEQQNREVSQQVYIFISNFSQSNDCHVATCMYHASCRRMATLSRR